MKKLLFITLLAFLICSCNSTTPNSGGQGSDPGGGQGLDPGTDPGTEDPKELSNVLIDNSDNQITTNSAELEEINAWIESLKRMLSSNIQDDFDYGLGN